MTRRLACLLVGLAAAARLLFLGSNPAGVFHDEAEKGYSAYCLTRVGGVFSFLPPPTPAPGPAWAEPGAPAYRPQLHPWPLFVDVWGSQTSMAYQYAAAWLVAAGGLNAWTLRLPAALAGTLAVFLTFFLARRWTGGDAGALWATAFAAFSPWHLVFSRWALEGIFVPVFLILALLCARRAWDGRRRELPLAALFAGIAFYAYAGARPFLLLFAGLLLLLHRREALRRWRFCLLLAAFAALAAAPTFYAMFAGGGAGLGRFQRLSVFAMDAPPGVRALLFVKNYLAHYSPQFLCLAGDRQPRHGIPGFGVLLHVEALLLVVGLFRAVRRRSGSDRVLLAWFLAFPFSAALTNEGIPHALRTLHAFPCPQILAAQGALACRDWLVARGRSGWYRALVAAYGLNAAALCVVLGLVYPRWSAPAFEYGIREALEGRGTGRVQVLLGPALPGVWELYHYHARSDPARLRDGGFAAGPVRLYPPGTPLEPILGNLGPEDRLLLSPGDAARGGAALREARCASRPILLPAAAWDRAPTEALRVVRRAR